LYVDGCIIIASQMVCTTDDTSSQCVVIETNLSQLTVGRDYTLTLQPTDAAGSPLPR
jgi:hypothetical protein